MFEIAHLLALVDAYEAAEKIGDTTLSFRVFGDSKKIAALRDKSDITTSRFNGAVEWFSKNWPPETKWPAHVQRPRAAA